ncbi:hypothetical protein [Candidatus Amarobacter glycogenicus]|uniref:hypothetical protein n=1 Tax=Candidatus Amarobacter glycogenicus TaxID=3140699 RepID=UPI002A0BC137|nr:hypothetical protein [Dehalococcoidia bacterium]
MNAEALPYTLLLIMAELSIGSLWITLGSDLRGGVTRGFVMTMALSVAIAAGLAYWTASGIAIGKEIDGYRIDADPFDDIKRALMVVVVTSAVYMFCVFMGWDPIGRLFGIAGSVAGVLAVVLLAVLLAPPTWGFPGSFLALVGGTVALGAVSVSMVWGHWYLTEGALPSWPLRDLDVVLLAALGLQVAVLAVNLFIPVRETPTPSNPIDVSIFANPALYLRIGVGLVFPIILGVLSYKTTQMKAMQSATGLLYIAMGAVFCGEVLAKGLLFLTGKPL